MSFKSILFLTGTLSSMSVLAEPETGDIPGDVHRGEDMIITTGHKLFPNTTIATPSFEINQNRH